jgi:hypothetical protein
MEEFKTSEIRVRNDVVFARLVNLLVSNMVVFKAEYFMGIEHDSADSVWVITVLDVDEPSV